MPPSPQLSIIFFDNFEILIFKVYKFYLPPYFSIPAASLELHCMVDPSTSSKLNKRHV